MPPSTRAEPADSRPARLDAPVLDRTWARLARGPRPPWLHEEVARRMGERLPIVKQVPKQVLDWWAALGASEAVLRGAYPHAGRLPVRRPGAPAAAPAASPWWRRLARGPRVLGEDEVADGAAQLLWSNMALHWTPDVPALLARWHRAIAVDGFLMFSTLGPGTLMPLRAAYAERGWGPPFAPFIDMHDLGDMLVEAGFADPVMDQEMLKLSFSSPKAALEELRGLGANFDRGRFDGLRTPAWRARLHAALQEQADAQGRCVLEFEVVYGHAFRPERKLRVADRTEVGLDEMKSMLSRRRSTGMSR
jgi:malonyl-CoA O-methyltransferase